MLCAKLNKMVAASSKKPNVNKTCGEMCKEAAHRDLKCHNRITTSFPHSQLTLHNNNIKNTRRQQDNGVHPMHTQTPRMRKSSTGRALVSSSFKFPNVENELQTIRELRFRYFVLASDSRIWNVYFRVRSAPQRSRYKLICVWMYECEWWKQPNRLSEWLTDWMQSQWITTTFNLP